MSFVLSANRLRDGHVIYLAENDAWTEHLRDARPLRTSEEQESARSFGADAELNCELVAPDLVPLAEESVTPTPLRLREVIRAEGPTVRPDLARQSQ